MKFKDKVALVTGAGCGIGKAVALAFAREGAKVVVNDVNADAIETTLAEIVKLGGEGLGITADVSNAGEVKDMFARTMKKFGTLDILVNNAGIAKTTDEVLKRSDVCIQELMTSGRVTTSVEATRNMTDEAWDRVLAVHLYGTFYCTREALNIMEDRGKGKIINMASIAGILGIPGSPDYSAAKGAIIAFTKSVAREVIARGVYVNAIAPGWIDTPLLTNQLTPTFRFVAITQTPVGRMGTPEEVATVALFLASDDASFVVGQVICPTGGGYV
ncbi:MAG: SDR family oxidoreductase [Dehalococcoidia bacterium]